MGDEHVGTRVRHVGKKAQHRQEKTRRSARDDDVVKQSCVPTSFTPVAEADLFRESLSLELGQP